jgi:hypothetical protein
VALLDHAPAYASDDVIEWVIHECTVVNFCALMLPEADEQHLHQAALVIAKQLRVRLHAPHHHDVVCCHRVATKVNGDTLRRVLNHRRLHPRAHGAAEGFLGDAVVAENSALAVRRAAAVAAHRRDDERLRSGCAEKIHGRF